MTEYVARIVPVPLEDASEIFDVVIARQGESTPARIIRNVSGHEWAEEIAACEIEALRKKATRGKRIVT